MKKRPLTHQITEKAFELLEKNPEGIQWKDLNTQIIASNSEFHSKTVNGTVWKLVEKHPDKVHKPEKGLFQLLKYKK